MAPPPRKGAMDRLDEIPTVRQRALTRVDAPQTETWLAGTDWMKLPVAMNSIRSEVMCRESAAPRGHGEKPRIPMFGRLSNKISVGILLNSLPW